MSLADELRGVYGLHAFAELFGFDWDSDWVWHDVACAMADRVEAELGEKVRRQAVELDRLRVALERRNSELAPWKSQAERLVVENQRLREELADMQDCGNCAAMLDCDECLRADASHKERKGLDYQNAKLRELFAEVWPLAEYYTTDESELDKARDLMRELGMEVDE